MVVPYGDPNDPHYRKNAFDAGEDGLGKNAHSLKKVCQSLVFCQAQTSSTLPCDLSFDAKQMYTTGM